MNRASASILSILYLVVAPACAHAPKGGGIRISESVRFEAYDGRAAFLIQPTGAGVRVEDGKGRTLVVLTLQGESLTIRDPGGQVVAVVLPPSEGRRGYQVVSPDRGDPLYALRLEPDGDLSVYDAKDERLYQAKRRDYGFKVVDRDGRVQSKVRVKPEKISLRDSSGVTFLTTRDPFPPPAAAALALEGLPFGYAAGLSIALTHWEPAGGRQERSNFSSR